MATILVIGASRGIGLETVKAALAAGHDVRAFARSAQGIPVTHAKLTKISGDALDSDNVAAAVQGALDLQRRELVGNHTHAPPR